MKKLLSRFSIVALTLLFMAEASSEVLVREFKGSGNKTTAYFDVKGPWIVDWRVSSDFPKDMGLQVDLLQGRNDLYVGKIITTKWIGNGVKMFEEGGKFSFKVGSSFSNWTLRVIELSKEEAATYTPKAE